MYNNRQYDEALTTKEYFDGIAEEFDSYYHNPNGFFARLSNVFLRKPVIKKRLQLSLEIITSLPVHRVLDVGCGSGVLAFPLAKRGYDVVGIDFSQRMIDIARERSLENGLVIDFQVADFMDGEFLGFGSCAALGVLEYIKDPLPLLTKMVDTVGAGGLVVFDLPEFWDFHTLLRLPYLLWRRQKAYFYTRKKCQKLVDNFNSQLISSKFYYYGAGYLIVLRKK